MTIASVEIYAVDPSIITVVFSEAFTDDPTNAAGTADTISGPGTITGIDATDPPMGRLALFLSDIAADGGTVTITDLPGIVFESGGTLSLPASGTMTT